MHFTSLPRARTHVDGQLVVTVVSALVARPFPLHFIRPVGTQRPRLLLPLM